jgi:ribosome modulation factor
MSNRIEQDAYAWQQGFESGASGQPNRCPYEVADHRSLAWTSGYIEGKAHPGQPAPYEPATENFLMNIPNGSGDTLESWESETSGWPDPEAELASLIEVVRGESGE